MIYTMYHKNIPTISFNLTDTGFVDKIVSVQNKEHIHPFFLIDGKIPKADDFYPLQDNLVRWMKERNIPASRKNLSSALASLGVKTTDELAKKCFYLSLTDQYWIAPKDLFLDWNKLNFFKNDFSEDVGKALFGNLTENPQKKINLSSPDSNTTGRLVKKWIIEDGKRILVKGGSGTEQLEPFNEVLASEICKRLNIKAVKYELFIENRKHFSKCPDFINENTELITIAEICDDLTDFKEGFVSYDNFKKRCKLLNLNLNETELGKIFILDYLIANEDRHLNNFGFIRNADTLEYKGLAPIFDSGTSMFYSLNDFELENEIGLPEKKIQCKPFSNSFTKQLSLIPLQKCLAELDLSKLSDIGQFYKNLLLENQRNISKDKINKFSKVLQTRVKILKEIKRDKNISEINEIELLKRIKLHHQQKKREYDYLGR